MFAFTAEYLEFCFATALGGDASTLWPKFSWLSIMQASELLVPSPFGRSFLRLPPWFQEALRDHGFGPHQSDGHVLMLSCLRVATEDDALVIDDQPTLEVVGDRLTWTDCFAPNPSRTNRASGWHKPTKSPDRRPTVGKDIEGVNRSVREL